MPSQTPKQVRIAYKLVDYGASMILEHYPHVIQAYEIYKNFFITYLLSNFQICTHKFDLNTK
ncbi:CapA family protein [Clostridium coskatii]|uniref:CapA family protein n=1 Tax=Clostridium coskatii TaxID=1705578 RepID=UPI003D6FD739